MIVNTELREHQKKLKEAMKHFMSGTSESTHKDEALQKVYMFLQLRLVRYKHN